MPSVSVSVSVALGNTAPIVGHVGDGNFHCALLADVDDPREQDMARELADRIAL